MALETLVGVKKISGFPVEQYVSFAGCVEAAKSGSYILVDHENNKISFRLQKGPIKEVGVNGCQVDALLETAGRILESFNKTVPCEETTEAIEYIQSALECLEERRKDREMREVEGTSQL